jgi:hypothetical protein
MVSQEVPNGVSSAFEFVGDFTNPILKPEAAEVVKQRGTPALAAPT